MCLPIHELAKECFVSVSPPRPQQSFVGIATRGTIRDRLRRPSSFHPAIPRGALLVWPAPINEEGSSCSLASAIALRSVGLGGS
jgi:hypothetical protein